MHARSNFHPLTVLYRPKPNLTLHQPELNQINYSFEITASHMHVYLCTLTDWFVNERSRYKLLRLFCVAIFDLSICAQ